MRKFVTRCLVMIALVGVSAAVALVTIPPDREDYLAIVGTKVEKLEAAPSPKIVFVGGSNLAFGIDSAAVEKALGYPVVNMGMGFNMGLRFMLDVVEPRIRKGDIVVLVPEYNLFFGLLDGDERLLDVLELYPQGWQYVHSRQQFKNIATNLFKHVKFKVNRVLQQIGHTSDPDCVYCPQAFNDYGDLVAHLDKPSRDVARMAFLKSASQEVDSEAIDVVNAFARELRTRGARVLFLFPCLPQTHYDLRRAAIDRLEQSLQNKLEVEMPSTPSDYVYPLHSFYDWVYHLNREGRTIRTARVIEDIRPTVEAARRQSPDLPVRGVSGATSAAIRSRSPLEARAAGSPGTARTTQAVALLRAR
jgi:hypothetical protein